MSVKTLDKQIIGQKDFLTLRDLSTDTILDLLESAEKIKEKLQAGVEYTPLKGKTLGMIFEKSSTRTRVSFEVGMLQLGGHALFLSSNDIQIGRGETISDTAKVLSEYIDGIMIRTFGHDKIEELANAATIPVINGLTDTYHPCQALADLLTIKEIKGSLKGLKLAYIGDGNNVVHSLMLACAKTGIDIAIASPKGYEPDADIVKFAEEAAEIQGSKVLVTQSPIDAIKDADIVYADVWTSMGYEQENITRLEVFKPYQINAELIKHAKPNYLFMHCLPAHRGEEVTGEIIDGPNSVVFHQAGNRLHAQKAVLVDLLS
ncbi:ornithine carbamoyltransferase [Peribacillus psychrosaccharolyticus]|uniref:Ornithine carbamoyltransferase n=2 Tax=Peribacillus psychrosaccharolyticus TaxID=1407 RepID=A0A974S1Z7_PERPY|nr:ornithine carbamoyltransferase [Peribacillus psychrosaccharolyticus]MEC2055018.1 ornithine carbamoyltransferase [Peribacillus psychrosaccharolyticus]MED3746481.1 ornithine carbamoyltransferase [Peribacillus psychrosaccharolyticus]QQT02066.1 ornithine carbamoyltransferase [Peribacillus psychrosaccharolyticus]